MTGPLTAGKAGIAAPLKAVRPFPAGSTACRGWEGDEATACGGERPGRSSLGAVRPFPAAPRSEALRLREEVDDFVCLALADDFAMAGQFFENFPLIGDEEIKGLMASCPAAEAAVP